MCCGVTGTSMLQQIGSGFLGGPPVWTETVGGGGGGLCEGRNSNKTGKSLLLGEQSLIMIQENTAFLSSQ